MAERPLISIVVPVFNEEENIEPMYEALNRVLLPLSQRYRFELLFTDNHSNDRSFDILRRLATQDARVRILRFSRNIGFQNSIYSGFIRSSGSAAIQIDCDLQDPPELIPQFLEKWEQGFQVVYGRRSSRTESWWMNFARRAFYRLIDALSEYPLPHDAGDFRLIDRCIVDQLKLIDDSQPYLRGAIATLGFNQTGIAYDRNRRERGNSKFSMVQLLGLALDGILNHSVVPLRIATYSGLLIAALTVLGIITYAVAKVVLHKTWPPGFATLAILILASISLNALFLGVIGEYLGRIYRQVKKRPLAIVEFEGRETSVHTSSTPLPGSTEELPSSRSGIARSL